jgi:hypothetical protein
MARYKIGYKARYNVELLAPARLDLEVVTDYCLRSFDTASVQEITDKLLKGLKWLEVFPLTFPLAPYKDLAQQRYRVLNCGKCVCLYKLISGEVFVYHILAAAADYPALF